MKISSIFMHAGVIQNSGAPEGGMGQTPSYVQFPIRNYLGYRLPSLKLTAQTPLKISQTPNQVFAWSGRDVSMGPLKIA